MRHQRGHEGLIEVPIHDLGHRGEGVGRFQGQTVFIRGALPGDTVMAQPFESHKRYQRAHLVKLLSASPERTSSPCPVFPRCGGCQLQHLSYEAQLEWKEERVARVLQRLGGITKPVVLPIIAAPSRWEYRNKAQFPVQMVAGHPSLGFFEQYSHRLVPAEKCLVQHPAICAAATSMLEHLQALPIAPYDESDGSGTLRHVLARASFSYDELLITLVMAQASFKHQHDLVTALHNDLPSLVGVTLNVNDQRGNRILGRHNVLLWGRDYLRETLSVSGMLLEFHVSAPSFFQVNPLQAQTLYSVALEYAQVHPRSKLLDAYCGTGGVSLVLAKAGAAEVWGIDIVQEAIEDAQKNARINGLDNAWFYAGRVEEIAWQLTQKRGIPDVIIVDPPRAGLDSTFLKHMADVEAERWVYISCNPVTLARDIKLLQGCGYRLVQVQPLDMFPHTAHIECVALLESTRSGGSSTPAK
jgi:23S rRNA (uracil1939-C5)-methyltransferase